MLGILKRNKKGELVDLEQIHIEESEPRIDSIGGESYLICKDKNCKFHGNDIRFRWICSRYGDWYWQLRKYAYRVSYTRFMNPYPYPVLICSGTTVNISLKS